MNKIYWCVLLCFFIAGCCKNPVTEKEPHNGKMELWSDRVFPSIDEYPAWSPDGTTIAYYHMHVTRLDPFTGYYWIESDPTGLWLINVDGTNPRMILRDAYAPCWSPDGRWLAFRYGSGLYKATVNGDSLTCLIGNGVYTEPRWSPDGNKIVCWKTFGDSTGLWLVNPDGSGRRYFADGTAPDWTPDGDILYAGDDGMWIESLDHAVKRQVRPWGSRIQRIDPSGQFIVFIGQFGTVCKINVDGTGEHVVGYWTAASWLDLSPDGSQIVYQYWVLCEYSVRNGLLMIMNTDGTDKRQLTFGSLGGNP